jgi:hypothetical protein
MYIGIKFIENLDLRIIYKNVESASSNLLDFVSKLLSIFITRNVRAENVIAWLLQMFSTFERQKGGEDNEAFNRVSY